jgi:two-component system, OmpR family, alkaline phosphatase synthesis response regulator PhoP
VTETDPAPLIAIVEDDAAIAEGLALNLRLAGYRTEVAADGEAAVAIIDAEHPALVLLDISLPKRSGLWVLETLRGASNHVPVIVLSARQDEFDKVAALGLGADDYVTKPFALAELLARVGAVLRRSRIPPSASPAATSPAAAAPATGAPIRFANVVVDLASRTVTRAGEPVPLTHLEFELLSFFCRNSQRVFSREELLRDVWNLRPSGHPRTVDNFVGQLRAKLEIDPEQPLHFLTVRGSGYRFVP